MKLSRKSVVWLYVDLLIFYSIEYAMRYWQNKQILNEMDENVLNAVQNNLNNRPRKTLGFRSLIELFNIYSQNSQPVAFET